MLTMASGEEFVLITADRARLEAGHRNLIRYCDRRIREASKLKKLEVYISLSHHEQKNETLVNSAKKQLQTNGFDVSRGDGYLLVKWSY